MHERLLNRCIAIVLLASSVFADPLAGKWKLDLERTHYGGGAEVRKQETFTCEPDAEGLKCTIESVRADGRTLVATFTTTWDGKPHPVSGMPDVDEVMLQKRDEFIADATFRFQGKPVFGYRTIQSDSGKSLTIVAVEPTTRVVLNSVVVYDRVKTDER